MTSPWRVQARWRRGFADAGAVTRLNRHIDDREGGMAGGGIRPPPADLRFAELLIASPPGDIFDGGGIHRIEHEPGYERDFDGRGQQATKCLRARLPDALGVPLGFEPAEAPSVLWWEAA